MTKTWRTFQNQYENGIKKLRKNVKKCDENGTKTWQKNVTKTSPAFEPVFCGNKNRSACFLLERNRRRVSCRRWRFLQRHRQRRSQPPLPKEKQNCIKFDTDRLDANKFDTSNSIKVCDSSKDTCSVKVNHLCQRQNKIFSNWIQKN